MAMLWFVLALAWEGTNFVVCLHGGPLGSICCLAVGCACSLTSKEAYRRSAARRRRSSHTHTFALRLNRDPRSVGQCVSTTPARTHTHTHTCVHKRYICRTVAHWRFYARDLLLALGGPALGGSGRGSCLWGPRPNAGSPRPHGQWWRRVHRPPEVPPCKDQRARQQACLPFFTATGKLASQPASWPAGQVAR